MFLSPKISRVRTLSGKWDWIYRKQCVAADTTCCFTTGNEPQPKGTLRWDSDAVSVRSLSAQCHMTRASNFASALKCAAQTDPGSLLGVPARPPNRQPLINKNAKAARLLTHVSSFCALPTASQFTFRCLSGLGKLLLPQKGDGGVAWTRIILDPSDHYRSLSSGDIVPGY